MRRRLFTILSANVGVSLSKYNPRCDQQAAHGRVKRRLLNLVTAASLALFVAFVALWIAQPFYFLPTLLPFRPQATPELSD